MKKLTKWRGTSEDKCQLVDTTKYCQHLINNMTRKLYQPRVALACGAALLISLQLIAAHAPPHQHHKNSGSSSKFEAQDLVPSQQQAQARVGGLDPSDYIDEAGELDVMLNQQQIPTAQLMSAAGHIVPDNFFMPGGSIPAAYYLQQQRLLQHQQQQQAQQQHQQQQHVQQAQQQQQQSDQMQQAASQLATRVVAAPVARHYGVARSPLDLLVAAAEQQQQHVQQQQQHNENQQNQIGSLIDFNGYSLTTHPDMRDAGAPIDLMDFLGATNAGSSAQINQNGGQVSQLAAALYEQQLVEAARQHPSGQTGEQNAASMLDQLQALASNNQQQLEQQQQQQLGDGSAQGSEHYQLGSAIGPASMIGPDYQLISGSASEYSQQQQHNQGNSHYNEKEQHSGQQQHHQQQHKPYGLPTKSSSKEPAGMLKPLGNPKTVTSPVIDFVANNLPKTSGLEKLAEKIPQHQTPTVFSFSSSKDPSEKVRVVQQKKRTVMRQAEQMARMLIKSINDKFGTTLGDQSDIPFLLSSLGPLGVAQNLLLDPTLIVTLLNSAEKTYFGDVLPGPAKSAIKPVLNLFRVPNKKRDKANLLNIISYLTSGGQTGTSVPSKHRLGIEKSSSFSSSKKQESSSGQDSKDKDKNSR